MRSGRLLRGTAVAGLVLIGTGVVAACGGGSGGTSGSKATSNASAQLALVAAVAQAFSGSAVTATVSIDATAAQLSAALTAGSRTGTAPNPTQVAALVGSTIVYSTRTTDGSPLPQAKSGSTDSSLTVTAPQGTAADLRSFGRAGALYAKLDLPALDSLLGKPIDVSRYRTLATKPGLAFVGDALDGKWVGLTGLSTLTSLLSIGQAPASASAASGGLFQQFLTAVAKDTTVVDTGKSAQGEAYTITGNSRKIATDLVTVLSTLPGASLVNKQLAALPAKLPDGPVTVQAYVTGGKLTRVQGDLAELASGASASALAGQHVPVVIALSTTAAPITQPAGAVVVDSTTLLQSASSLLDLGSLVGGASSAAP